MVAKAVYNGRLHNEAELARFSDEKLLTVLEESPESGASEIAKALRTRRLYKSIYSVGEYRARYQQERLSEELHDSPDRRAELEADLARDCGVSPADIIVYCPEPDMALKQAAVKVRWIDDSIRPLNTIKDDPPKGEIEEIEEIEAKHRALWRLSVFLRPDLVDSKAQALSDACVYRWEMFNENPKYRSIGPEPRLAALDRMARGENLTVGARDELWEAASRSQAEPPRTEEQWRTFWLDARSDAN